MNPDITILTTTRVTLASWIDGDGVKWSEMASDAANLLLENLVVETRFELSLAGRGGCDVHGCLATSKNDKVFLWGDGGGVERSVGDVGLHDFEVAGVDDLSSVSSYKNPKSRGAYLGGLVLACGDEICPVWRPLKICDWRIWLMCLDIIELLSGLLLSAMLHLIIK
jgi:hypothetical protein